MFRKMDKTWSVVIQCLRDKKKLMEIGKVGLEKRWE
jgi:hypothetical protein